MPNPSGPPKNNDNDAELIRSINDGRQELFFELVRRYEKSLYNFGLRMCGNPSDAEDMVQDTFLNVFRYLKGFRYETKFKNWLYRVATSACLKKKRRSKFAPERELSLDEFLPADESAVSKEVPSWASQPLTQVLDEELGGIIRNALLELPEKYRLVIVLRDVEGFSTQEAAEILDLTPSNIKVRLHRARLFLREALRAYYET
ncbi:RNA polymerase sigma factor [Desulfosarcina ovata subsp. sediminis]|uniref:RNA polymerase sigma factor n=1 Tax=Desulfosarcina ovata subsp. sediminis TaxID=885957 RepID=A0A5K7ZWW6_9BACT|nr:RNA polymerase sigma factor [Desulfosarcina ovata]BBO84718.1 RNA polymerase sigma factor [Desulfosarcina ovata subsp. sediminis]